MMMVAMSMFIQTHALHNRVASDKHAPPNTSEHARCRMAGAAATCHQLAPLVGPTLPLHLIAMNLLLLKMFIHYQPKSTKTTKTHKLYSSIWTKEKLLWINTKMI